MAFGRSRTPATKTLRGHLKRTGTDPRTWTPEQRAEHSRLSDAALREQAGQTGDSE